MTASSPRLVCVGNLTIDDAVLPDGRRRDHCLGGDALYAALAARLFEPDTAMLAPVGRDLHGEAAAAMRRAGFDPERQPARDAPTIRNVVTYDAHGGRTWQLLNDPSDFHTLSVLPADVPPPYLDAAGFMIAAMSLESQEELTPWLRANSDACLFLDLQEDYCDGNKERVLAIARAAHVFLPSEEEVRRLLGTEDYVKAARELAALGPHVVVIKQAEHGCLVYRADTDECRHVPAVTTGVLDATGAGDAFCGAFAAVYLQTRDPLRAARAGAAAASIAISGFGNEALLRATPAQARERLAGVLG